MLARKTVLPLPSGRSLETPLLVPSVSSKGAGLIGDRPGSFDQIEVFEATLPALRRPVGLLISSYDLHYRFIPREPFTDASSSLKLDLLLVDSGSYETLPFEGDPPYVQDVEARPWGESMFQAAIEGLHSATDVALVSFDNRDTYEAQIEVAQGFFRNHPGAVSDVLLKPPPTTDGRAADFHNLEALRPHAAALNAFDVIGVTEKELDATPVGRLVKLGRLRELLDRSGVTRPIHVFGGLDPLWTPLYVAAGAEIIDGLSWWRYAFGDGIAAYRDVGVLGDDALLDEPLKTGRAIVQQSNLGAVDRLLDDVNAYIETGEWAHFPRREILERTYDAMIDAMRR
jgi:hypothetical protein